MREHGMRDRNPFDICPQTPFLQTLASLRPPASLRETPWACYAHRYARSVAGRSLREISQGLCVRQFNSRVQCKRPPEPAYLVVPVSGLPYALPLTTRVRRGRPVSRSDLPRTCPPPAYVLGRPLPKRC